MKLTSKNHKMNDGHHIKEVFINLLISDNFF